MATKHFHSFFATFLFLFVLQPFIIQSLELEFVQTFQRAQKGNIIDGVNQIKKYLKTYGYYPRDIKQALDNYFDDSLESALKAYQNFNHLDLTGKIDSNTIKAMMIPRCAVPDIQLVSNYNISSYKWRKYGLTYSIENLVNVFTEAQMTPSLQSAFKSWHDASPFTFNKARKGTQGDIKVAFVPASHRSLDPLVFNNKTFAHAIYPIYGSRYIGMNHFNADSPFTWSLNPTKPKDVDVESIFLHEVGHNLGLNHSGVKSAVMYASFPAGKFTKRVLTKDDKDGLKALYRFTRP